MMQRGQKNWSCSRGGELGRAVRSEGTAVRRVWGVGGSYGTASRLSQALTFTCRLQLVGLWLLLWVRWKVLESFILSFKRIFLAAVFTLDCMGLGGIKARWSGRSYKCNTGRRWWWLDQWWKGWKVVKYCNFLEVGPSWMWSVKERERSDYIGGTS